MNKEKDRRGFVLVDIEMLAADSWLCLNGAQEESILWHFFPLLSGACNVKFFRLYPRECLTHLNGVKITFRAVTVAIT